MLLNKWFYLFWYFLICEGVYIKSESEISIDQDINLHTFDLE